jgi:hypothetical protein
MPKVRLENRNGPRRGRLGRWRAISLAAVHVLIAAHIVHWRVGGRTLAPLELNEVMYTLELGIVTAGFIFMSLAVLSTAIFGRFFCSWGCPCSPCRTCARGCWGGWACVQSRSGLECSGSSVWAQ